MLPSPVIPLQFIQYLLLQFIQYLLFKCGTTFRDCQYFHHPMTGIVQYRE